ncbi:related to tol protein [Fusarium fujikuroi]|nr:related to tol protein [Fusarium fujikuroi]
MASGDACCSHIWQVSIPVVREAIRDIAGDLGAQCSSIDLDAIRNGQEYKNVRLTSKRLSPCSLCRFFTTILFSDNATPVNQQSEVEFELLAKNPASTYLNIPSYSLETKAFDRSQVLRLSTLDYDSFQFAVSSLPNNSQDTEAVKFTILRLESDRIDFRKLKNWLAFCKSHHHKTCQTLPGYPHELSCLRVIECQTGAIIKAPEGSEFAALSYVWGHPQGNESSMARKDGFLPPQVPKTIGDAIQATIRLNLQYLWVDQYCINQKDEAELADQVGIMDMVYNLATVTLIAACGKDAHSGLPGVGSTPRAPQPLIKLHGRAWVSSDPESLLVTKIKISRWWTRAWTYQEGLFSRRRIFFTETEVYFECNDMCTQESVPFDLHDFRNEAHMEFTGIYRGGFTSRFDGSLDKHLLAISQRQLTYQSDELNAARGIFRAFSSMPTPMRHFWGIPLEKNANALTSWAPNLVATSWSETDERGPYYLDSCFADGLGWIPEATSHRREGFPNVKIWLQKTDGTYDRISDSVVTEIDANKASGKFPYTQVLRMESRTIQVTFRYRPENGFERPYRHRNWAYPKPVYFVVTLSDSDYQYHHGTWDLCEDIFDCHLLSAGGSFGLVVREGERGIAERLGYIDTHDALAWKPEGPSGNVSTINRSMAPGLADHVSVKIKTVLLG